jgi:signal transduction histidine kinase
MSENREEILALCIDRMRRNAPDRTDEELADDMDTLIDEVVRALARDAGVDTNSPLPGRSETAMHHGGDRQRRGYPIANLAMDIGSISDSVGELGARRGLSFAAREYQVFNQCIDTAIGSSLEQFSRQEHEQQDEETTERFGFLAHELRNALSGGRVAFAILKHGQVGINSRTGAILERSLARVEALISQTLLAVQLRAGIKAEPRRIRVADFVHDLAEAAIPERNVCLLVEVDDTLEVDADERLLVSAVSNLIQNALKFTHPGGKVVLRGRSEPQAVVIEVEDECGGLPSGKLEELFRPYVQRGPDRRGLGLGLAITREAIEAHGGELAVTNLPGKGCIFAVRLREPAP